MSSGRLATVMRRIRKLAHLQEADSLTDSELLQGFALRHDHSAFAVLVKRHGAMVLRLCRRLLHDEHDAEDAFQATFLVLARKAKSIHKSEAIVSWLHGVAHRVCMKAIRNAARQRKHQGETKYVPQTSPHWHAMWQEVQVILDEEIQRLPEPYRATFLLCSIEGQGCTEAARKLGVEEGTVRSRLTRARQQLRKSLTKRGVELGTILATFALSPTSHASGALFSSTVKGITLFTASGTEAAGLISQNALVLAKGIGEAMLMTKVKLGSVVLALGIAWAGVCMGIHHVTGEQAGARESLSKPMAQAQFSTIANQKAEAAKGDERDEPKGAVTISGQVLDPEGKPCPNAKLYIFGNAQQEKATPPSRAIAGPDGRFRFSVTEAEAIAGRVVATAKGYGPDLTSLTSHTKGELVLRVAPDDVPITGRVLDLQGQPVAGASVRVVLLGKPTDGNDLISWAERQIGSLKNTGYANGLGLISIASPPIGALTSATTDKEGRFLMKGSGRNRALVLEVSGPNIEHKRIWVSTFPTTPKILDGTVGVYGPTFEHVAGPARIVIGKVTDKETGKPVPNVRIIGSVRSIAGRGYARGLQIEANSDSQGNYQLEGLPKDREYHITADTLQGMIYLPQEQAIADQAGLKPLTVNFPLERGTLIEGRLKDQETGRPVAGTVRYFPLPGNEQYKTTAQGKLATLLLAHRPVGHDGVFKLLAFPGPGVICGYGVRGAYVSSSLSSDDLKIGVGRPIFLGDEGFMSAEWMSGEANHVIRPDEKTEKLLFDLELIKGRKLSGTVLNSDGKPVAGIRGDAIWSNSPATRITVDDRTGTFTADGIPPQGERTLVFFQPAQKLAAYAPVRGDANEPMIIRLQPWSHVEGRILDLDGRPLPGAKVRGGIFLEQGRVEAPSPVITDKEGRFKLEGLIPGLKANLTVYAPIEKGETWGQAIHFIRNLSIEAGKTINVGDQRIRKLEE